MWKFIFFILIFTFISCGSNSTLKSLIKPESAITSYKKCPLFIENLTNDSLTKFFKVSSQYKSLPISFNYDSLSAVGNNPAYNIRMLPFISKDFHNEYEPSTFSPFCYEFDSSNKIHFFYIYIESMPNTNVYRAIALFTCDSNFKLIDALPISESWLFSGSAGSSRSYNRKSSSMFILKEDGYDIDNIGNGNGTNYIIQIKSTISISKEGNINFIKSDTLSHEEIIKFDC